MHVVPNTATLASNETSKLTATMTKRKSATDFEATHTPQPIRSNSNQQKLGLVSGFETNSATKAGTEGVKALTSVDIVQLTKYEEAVINSPKTGMHSRNWRGSNQQSNEQMATAGSKGGQSSAIKQQSSSLPYPTVREAVTAERA